MDNLFQSKWFVGIISLVFAVSLFIYVEVESNPTKKDTSILPGSSQVVQSLEDVPLEVRMDTDQYVVSGVPNYINVSLEGRTTVLTRTLKQNNFTLDRQSTRLNSSHVAISYAVFCLKKKII